MKKKLFFLIMLMSVGTMYADNLTVENVVIPQGGQGTIVVNYQFDVAEQYSGWQFSLQLPNEVITVKNAKGNSQFTAGTCHDESYTITSNYSEGIDNYVALSLESSPITGSVGMLISIPIETTAECEVGTNFQASLTGIQFGNKDGVQTTFFDDVNITITIGAPVEARTILDETSTSIPEAATGVDVKVLRTIKANNWSTICLPFAMTEEQVKAAFGNDVQLGDFTGCDVDDATGNINVKFSDVTAIEANHPYIIKVGENITEFTADGVDIVPEEEPAVDRDEETTGTGRNKKTTYNSFIGTYVAETIIPDYAIFLNGNKFWFSTGKSKMDAFRGYFDFATAGAEYDEESLLARKISFSFDGGETTGIKTAVNHTTKDGAIYNINGQRVEGKILPKGIYIKDNKKFFVR